MLAAIVALFLTTTDDAERLRRTAPSYLDVDTARMHYAAARAAGWSANVAPETLLAISWHESRYRVDVVTIEPGARVSCGVGTPVPHAPPCTRDELSMVGGYTRLAEHFAGWLAHEHGNETRAVWGYAGGGAQIVACLGGSSSRACGMPAIIEARSAAIRDRAQRHACACASRSSGASGRRPA